MSAPSTINRELLSQLLQSEVRSYTTDTLTKPGENYGGILLALTVQLDDPTEKQIKTVNLVAKMTPPSPLLYKLFNSPVTFCKEVDFYRLVIRSYEELLGASAGLLSIYPRYHGSHLTDPSRADRDAVLLLENLKTRGYKSCDQYTGLDLKHTELALRGLAKFHAAPMFLQRTKPDVFATTVSTAGRPWNEGLHVEESYAKKWMTTALDAVRSIPECAVHVDKVVRFLERQPDDWQSKDHTTKLFATLIHRDFWTNNIMFRYEDDDDRNTPTDLKIIDFQLTAYDTPVNDLILLLYTSTEESVRKDNFEHLLETYHSGLISHLQEVNCDTSALTFDRFIQEFHTYAHLEFARVLVLLKVMCAEPDQVLDLHTFTEFDHILDGEGSAVYKRRVKELVLEFVDNGWLETLQ